MNRHSLRWASLIPLGCALFWLAGCSSPSPMSRIDANRALYDSFPFDMQSAILDGKAVKGMTPDMVRMALGNPTRVEPRPGSTTGEETWIYEKSGSSSGRRPTTSVGGGIGGIGVSSGRRGGGGRGGGGSARPASNAEQTQVVFQNGVVTRAD